MPGYAPSLGSGSSMGTQAGTFGGGSSSGSTTGSSSRPGRTEPGQRSNLAAANEAQFFSEQGITSTNPFGKQGFFSKFFGIDPKNISYANIMSPNQMANVAALNYDRYTNPFAEVNVLGNPTGANPELGVVRSGLKSGDVTALGTVKSVAQPKSPMIKGIASFLPGATAANILNALMPAPTVNMIEGAGMAGTGIPSAFAEQERMGRLTERTGSYSQPSGLSQMVSDMMNFFSPNQQTTNIQPSDVSTGMSAYSETGRQVEPTAQFSGNTDAISNMVNEYSSQNVVPGTGTSSFYSNLTNLGVAPVESVSASSRPTSIQMMSPEDVAMYETYGTLPGLY